MKPLIAKLTRPRLNSVIERKRLLEHLDRARENKIVWISAPAGSGKTTLVANWLDSRKLRCIWYQADAGDADIATFFFFMRRALKHAAPKYRKPLPLLTPEYSLGIPTFTKRFFETLFSRLVSSHASRRTSDKSNRRREHYSYAVVIDNYQDVPAETLFHEVIRDGLSVAPDGIPIIIVSRSDPPPVFSRMQVGGQLAVLDKDQVGFTIDESRELIALRGKKKLDDDVFKTLYRVTEGWAAGLMLLAESPITRDDLPELWEVPRDRVFDYFAAELFGRTDDETRDFLMKTSFLPRMTLRTATDLTGYGHADNILSRLSRNNFFIQRHTTPEIVYQYHPLFREFLLSRAKDVIGSDEILEIKKKAALLLLTSRQIESAIELLADAGDWEANTHLILTRARSLVGEGRFTTLREWIDRIPKEISEHQPWLLYWKGVCAAPSDPTLAELSLKKAFELFSDNDDLAGILMSLCSLQDVILNIGAFHLFQEWISLMEKVLDNADRSFPSPDLEQRVIMNMISALTCSQPHHPDTTSWTDKGYALLGKRDVPLPVRFCIAVHLNIYYLWTGDFSRAKRAITVLREISRSENIPEIFAVWQKVQETLHSLATSSPEECIASVTAGLDFTAQCGIPMWDNHLILCGMLAAARSDDWVTFNRLNNRLCMEKANLLDTAFNHKVLAIERFRNNDFASSFEHIHEAVKKYEASGFKTRLGITTLPYVEMYLKKGDKAAALAWLRRTKEFALAIKSRIFEYYCDLFGAHIALLDGDVTGCLTLIRKAFSIGRENGYSRVLWIVPYFLADLCMRALENGIETEYARELIRAHRLARDAPPLHIESWPWSLKVYTLGRFEMVVDDKPVRFPGRVQQKPLAMLKAIVAFGGKDATEEQLIDALWPDADGDVAHKSFDTTLHRLRKLVNNDNAIMLQEGRVSLDERYCWVDTIAFERALCHTEEAWKADKGQSRGLDDTSSPAELIEKIVGTYKGHFLPGDKKQPWTISLRERLRAKFMHSINTLGRYWMEAGRYDKAVHVFMNGLEIDDLAEEFYQHLMVCYNQLGQQAEAVKVYNRCRSVLRSSLGLKPSSKTEVIYYAIRQGK